MSKPLSLSVRAIMAVGLMLGFYLLAILIAAGLLFVPYSVIAYGRRVPGKLIAICTVAGLAILWSILPRLDRFKAPGPPLRPETHTRLFDFLRGVATEAKQAMPSEVYLVPDLNAWVAQRGGIMGFGSRRVMGLGLPLLQILSASQLKAVVAHEFGHYFRGDTKLGPWVYKTRSAIGRTLQSLSNVSSFIQAPFRWYAEGFLRVTHAVSRNQEFVADELAAQIAGASALTQGLKKITGNAGAFLPYFHNEVQPVLAAGFFPPIAQGFARFAASPDIAGQIQAAVDKEVRQAVSSPYDTHPSLKERLEALDDPGGDDAGPEDAMAVSLLDNLPALEREILGTMFPAAREKVDQLDSITWEEVPAKVYVPNWKESVNRNRRALAGLTPTSLPEVLKDPKDFAEKLEGTQEQSLSREQLRHYSIHILGGALVLTLLGKNWTLRAGLAEAVRLEGNGLEIKPFEVVQQLSSGELSEQDWVAKCDRAGISGFDFGTLPATKQDA